MFEENMTDTQVADFEEEDMLSGRYLVFHLDGQEFGIAIRYVVDIINVQPVTRVPNCPEYVRGITNLRGKVIPIIDMRLRFGKKMQEYNDRTCIIVVEIREMSVGLIIDSVSDVATFKDDQISPPPSFNQFVDAKFIEGIGKSEQGVKLILDCRAVLGEDLFDDAHEE